METVTLYTTHCPKCNVLESKMKSKRISYTMIEGDKNILELGFTSAPILKVGDQCMEFTKAIEWVNNIK